LIRRVSLYQNTTFFDHSQPYVERVVTAYAGILNKYRLERK